MGRRTRKEVKFQDLWLEKLITAFCVNVKKLRQLKKITQQQLAEESKLAVNTIAEIEQKRIENLRLSTITTLSMAFSVEPLSLLKSKRNH